MLLLRVTAMGVIFTACRSASAAALRTSTRCRRGVVGSSGGKLVGLSRRKTVEVTDLTAFPPRRKWWFNVSTLQGINISHLGKRTIIFKMPFWGDMLVPWRVSLSPKLFFSIWEGHSRRAMRLWGLVGLNKKKLIGYPSYCDGSKFRLPCRERVLVWKCLEYLVKPAQQRVISVSQEPELDMYCTSPNKTVELPNRPGDLVIPPSL